MWQTCAEYAWLCAAALLAGGINALAGGGTLLTFPALMSILAARYGDAAGVLANGTSTVALVPASLGSTWGFRREITALRRLLLWLAPSSILGGAVGAWLLVRFPDRFNDLIPWLVLTAAALFALQPYLSRLYIRPRAASPLHWHESRSVSRRALLGMAVGQMLIAIYGGYFGAGIGILMLSGLGLMGLTNIHEMNGLKSLLAMLINGVAVVVLIAAGKVIWPFALAMMVTSLSGGFLAAHYGRKIPGRYVRWLIVVIGFSLSGWYFLKNAG